MKKHRSSSREEGREEGASRGENKNDVDFGVHLVCELKDVDNVHQVHTHTRTHTHARTHTHTAALGADSGAGTLGLAGRQPSEHGLANELYVFERHRNARDTWGLLHKFCDRNFSCPPPPNCTQLYATGMTPRRRLFALFLLQVCSVAGVVLMMGVQAEFR